MHTHTRTHTRTHAHKCACTHTCSHLSFFLSVLPHKDKYDDMLIGVKSTALKLGDKTKPWLAGFSTVMISCLAATGMMCDQTWPYYTGIAAVAVHLAHQVGCVC